MTADGAAVLVSTLDSTVRLMDRANGQLLQAYRAHENKEYRVRSCLGLNDAVVVSGSEDGYLCAWDLLEGKVVEKMRAHEGKVASAVAWNGKGKEWASAGGDGECFPPVSGAMCGSGIDACGQVRCAYGVCRDTGRPLPSIVVVHCDQVKKRDIKAKAACVTRCARGKGTFEVDVGK